MKIYNGEKAIISLTSWKARINTVAKTLYSLLKQCPEFHIVLVLSEEEFPKKEEELPENLRLFIDNDLIEIKWTLTQIDAFKCYLSDIDERFNVPNIAANNIIYKNNFADDIFNHIKNKQKKSVNILIVHHNTPELTEALCKSIFKFTPNSTIYIFDNSDKRPFLHQKFTNIKYIDNTHGQVINFNKWLKKYPNRYRSGGRTNNFGSAKHCISVELCMNIINDDFILLDSDILLKADISSFVNKNYIYTGEIAQQPSSTIRRVLPFICYINVPLCKKKNIHYFDENHMHGLFVSRDADSYDTGASFFLNTNKLHYREILLDDFMVHFKAGSWMNEALKNKKATNSSPMNWLLQHKSLWQ